MSPEELRRLVAAELPDTPIMVALGGGADSAVAAWACSGHSEVRAVFVDHELESSASLRTAAVKLADFVDLSISVLSAPVEDGPNLESRARTARWKAMEAERKPGEVVVTGHSRDDLAETVLINLLRGAGARGLAAMAATRTGIARPLLGFDRAELRAAAEELGLPFTDDSVNLRTDLLRNRIRADLVPLLGEDYQSEVRSNLARAASHLALDDDTLESASAQVPIRDDEGAVLLPAAVLLTVPRPIAARAVRTALRRINPPYAGRSDDVHAVLRVAEGDPTTVTLASALTAAREGPYVAIWATEPTLPQPAWLQAPGQVRFGERRLTASAPRPVEPLPQSTVALDPGAFAEGLIVRGAETGERIDIDDGTKLIRDALAENGVPVRKRAAWPVLANDARIAAIVAGRVAPWARPSGGEVVVVTQEWM